MKEPTKARQVCIYSLSGVLMAYLVVGLLGYLAYGTSVSSPVIDSLPKDGFVDFNRFLMIVVILATFPLQAFPVYEIADRHYPDHRVATRVGVVLLPTVLGMALPHMAEAMGVLGGLATTMFGALIPFTMYMVCFEHDLTKLERAGWAILAIIVTVLGLWAAIVSAAELAGK